MRELTTARECELKLREFENRTEQLLMIDGQTVDIVLSTKQLEEMFFSIATLAPSVCVCRCSPTQKALIV